MAYSQDYTNFPSTSNDMESYLGWMTDEMNIVIGDLLYDFLANFDTTNGYGEGYNHALGGSVSDA